MAGRNDSISGNFESTAQRMLEALDKAGLELSKTVDACVEQLSQYNEHMQQSLSGQVEQIKKQFLSLSEGQRQELEGGKATLLQALEESGRDEIARVASSARAIRVSLNRHAELAEERILQLVELELANMRAARQAPIENLADKTVQAEQRFKQIEHDGGKRIDETETLQQESISSRSKDFENSLQELIAGWKEKIYSALSDHQDEFRKRADKAGETLIKLAEEGIADLNEEFQSGNRAIAESIESSRKKAESITRQWQEDIAQMLSSFSAGMARSWQDSKLAKSSGLEYKVGEAADEINGITCQTREKIQAGQKVLHSETTRLAAEYSRQIEGLFLRFETIISETSRRQAGSTELRQRMSDQLKEKLKNNLNSQREEFLKTVHKLAGQFENEFVRAGRNCEDRIESIRMAAVDSLEKQTQSIKLEINKINKKFQHEVDDLLAQADELEEAGKSAALTVLAYRSAMLSLDGE